MDFISQLENNNYTLMNYIFVIIYNNLLLFIIDSSSTLGKMLYSTNQNFTVATKIWLKYTKQKFLVKIYQIKL